MRQSRPVPKDKTDVGVRPTPDAHRRVACRGSRDKKQDQHEMRRVRTARKGVGPAERVRSRSARMQHCDKAGLNARLEIAGGRGGARGGDTGTEHFHPCLTLQITKKRASYTSPQKKGLRRKYLLTPREASEERNKMATSAFPFHPSQRLPATLVREDRNNTIAARVLLKNKSPAVLAPLHTV